ncbi:MAG: sulfur oxidation c-type cytochrome SoxA [Gammaproteobacteria bacterium]|nr:MAG: sulfur oxidation c-type cytochrome SoxA [Gammaproteobacteria bacterium]
MNKKIILLLTFFISIGLYASPESDRKAFAKHYYDLYPDVHPAEFNNGVYAIDAASKDQWESIEEFPPYEINVDSGKKLFETAFKNGKTYASCFDNGGIGIKHTYPRFDAKTGDLITMELALNNCRKANNEKPLKYKKGPLIDISAYLAFTSRGKTIDIKIPNDKRAIAWYEKGKKFFETKRGQLDMSCTDCHVNNVGKNVRADLLGPALGHTTHWPVYRSKWGSLGSLHRRYAGCNKNIRAKPKKPQSEEYRALEYYESFMGNGLDANGPGARK